MRSSCARLARILGAHTKNALRARRRVPVCGLIATGCALVLILLNPPAATAQSRDAFAQDLVEVCTGRIRSFAARQQRVLALGFQEAPGRTDRWVQGQLLHIAMSDLEDIDSFEWSEIKDTYLRFQATADEGRLFLDDSGWPDYTHAAMDMDLSLVDYEGEHSCSIALGRSWQGALPGLEPMRTWRSQAGDFTQYQLPGVATAHGSTLSDLWDRAIAGPRTVSGFLVLRAP